MLSRRNACSMFAGPLLLVGLPSVFSGTLAAQAGAPAGAQTGAQTAGTVSGTVLDPDAAVIPGATILLTPAKGSALSATSGGDGSFDLEAVPAGTYTFSVTMQGSARL